jgi:hypothetical protein
MKKSLTILSIIFITLVSLHVKAQDADEPIRSYLTLLGGASVPLGKFRSTNYYDNSAGFAKTGVTFGLDGVDYLYKHLGLGATITFQDQGELSANDVTTLANGYNASFVKDITTGTAVDRYNSFNFLIGPQYSFVYHKFILDLRAEAGVIKSTSTPSLAINFDYSTATDLTMTQLSSSALSFAYGASMGLRWSFSDNWDLGLKGNFVTSSGPKIENTYNTGTTGRFVTKQPISEVQTTLGITLRF